MSSTAAKPPLKPLSPQEWELLIDDFQHGRDASWTSQYSIPSILEQALSYLLKRDSPLSLKHSLILFMEEFSALIFQLSSLSQLMDTLRSIVQAPLDPPHYSYTLKEQMMVSTTSIFITIVDDPSSQLLPSLEGLVELLLVIINRPNHGPDRQTRGIACECLRELERAYPCLLSDLAGHLWSLCQSERTHASQSYILLFTQVVHNIAIHRVSTSILNTSIPLIPFNVPQWVLGLGLSREVSNCKELRRAMSFLLEWPHVFTPFGMMEFMGMVMPVAVALELQPSMLKVQFFGMIHSYDPLLCHVVLRLYLHFLDAFDGQEGEIARLLVSASNEAQSPLVFRLLALHWLLGIFNGLLTSDDDSKRKLILGMALSFYPNVFDPLALKALKLDLLALFSICLESSQREGENRLSMRNVFEKGLVSVSAFKWMPPWSTETAVAFRTFHKFLIDASSHSDADSTSKRMLTESAIFHSLQEMLVDLTLEFPRLVPVVVAFTNRFLGCQKHRCLGEGLLQTLDENLLPKVIVDHKLVAYFPLFDKIAESDTIPPRRLLELLTDLMVFIVKKHEPDAGLRAWSQGSKVLCICRTMMMHHQSSRLFVRLSRLLAFTCLYFPDLEVRDNARIYLRMLVCIPGKKLRELLNLGENLIGVAPSAQSGSFFNVQSPRRPHDPKRSRNVSAYVHLQRVIPLLVRQSWSLSVSTLCFGEGKPDYLLGVKDNEPKSDDGGIESSSGGQINSESERAHLPQEPLRVMDAKISQLLETLRRHFSCIPDFRHMLGIKVRIPCYLSFESEPFSRIWGRNAPDGNMDELEDLPAMYATVLNFSSSAPYGSIPSCRVPFLIGEPTEESTSSDKKVSSEIVPYDNGSHENDDSSRVLVMIELEPREPTPGLVDVFLESNAENGQIIRGQLHGITVGIEDMFLKAIIPSDVLEEATPAYNSDLFTSLWEAFGSSSNFGREIFPLQGGKGAAVISGTQSVKLLEVPASSLIQSIERQLAPFVVSVIGEPLVDLIRDGGIIRDVVWKDVELDLPVDSTSLITGIGTSPLALKYIDEGDEIKGDFAGDMRTRMGCIHILIFLPPRFHLLLQMEVGDVSTLVRIRTDHWPCLAYIDDYLEALYLAH
ncbi:hypothetical protein CDL15_Pgr024021 [Punica granatum]|uniref:Uncharacterized protein n=1 Tax=Punica granatum TaxID=22663 RepID=A0A218XVK9_PUNGR|nr:hypothetical protein CDL15_Pgr024021 [Punica granatum]